MASTYTWHPGANPVGPKWPIPVSLLPDELFSSWLVRVALAHGCDPLTLTRTIWPRWRVWCSDLDRGIDASHLKSISECSGINESSFAMTNLRTIIAGASLRRFDKATLP